MINKKNLSERDICTNASEMLFECEFRLLRAKYGMTF